MKSVMFYPLQGAHRDFFAISRSAETPRIRALFSRFGGMRFECGHAVLYLWNTQFAEALFLGYGIADGRFILGPASLPAFPDRITMGAAVAISSTPAGIRMRTDVGGLHVVYRGRGFVTNRLCLAASASGQMDVSATASLFILHHMFTQQFSTFRTPVKGVKIVQPGCEITVGQTLSFRDAGGACSSAIYDSGEIGPSAYRELIRMAAGEIIDTLRSGRCSHPRHALAPTRFADTAQINGS